MRSWGSMLRTVRAAIAVLLLGGLGLTVPPQTSDMLAFLEDGRIWPAVSFQIALIVLGASAWYWSRAALAARFGINDGTRAGPGNPAFDWFAFAWLPRLILAAAFLVGLVIAWRSYSPRTAAGALVLAILGVVLARYRRHGPPLDIPPAPRDGLSQWLRGGAWQRLCALLGRAPFGLRVATALLALGSLLLLVGVIEAFESATAGSLRVPNLLAAAFPGPGIAVLLLGLMIGPLVAATFVIDGLTLRASLWRLQLKLRRPPVLTVLLAYVFVLVPALLHVHTVRLSRDRPLQPVSLDDIYSAWLASCAPPTGTVRPIIVAVSGGATRAGLWGAVVLDRVLEAQRDDGPALFAVSSVSGGSLGVAAAMTLMSREAKPCRTPGLPALRAKQDTPVPLAGDALGPLLGGWLIDDIPRAFFDPPAALLRSLTDTRPNGGDSAEAIEHAFEDLWSAIRPSGAPGWDQPFLSLFYRADRDYRPGMPLWFANGTDATTGNRVITAPILAPRSNAPGSEPWPFRGARDFRTLLQRDVSIATAINNTARFPYLEPFGEMLTPDAKTEVGSLVDGGYFENEGLQTALDLAGWLKKTKSTKQRPVEPIIVQATGDGEADVGPGDVMTCAVASDGAFIPDTEHGAWQILAPLVGLYHVRGGHSAVLLREAHDDFCGSSRSFVHFYLPAYKGRSIPLNWVLSDETARAIWLPFSDDQVCNGTEHQHLRSMLDPSVAPPVANPAAACN